MKSGYRLIDSASHYFNENIVGQAVNECGMNRERCFIITKLWYSDMGYDATIKAFEESLKELNLSYVDLYLIHWPAAEPKYSNWEKTNNDTWKAMEEIYLSGRAKAIGTCNFMRRHMETLLNSCKIKPMVNQIENHPGFYQKEISEFCRTENIQLMAWQPLEGSGNINNAEINNIAVKYHKTAAEICLRWNYQHGFVSIPKTTSKKRMLENLEIFDFYIESKDMDKLDVLPFCGGEGAIVK